MDDAGNDLADRIRALLSADDAIEERRMFGTKAFLDAGRILVGARKGGVLLVRVDDENGAAMLTQPGVSRAVMGSRTMSSGWLDVAPSAIADDAALMLWLDVARESVGAAVEVSPDESEAS
ncbi:TfoX/Sxy family protein [Microbacterium paraoxydans]|uniref:TfoX/Sxy family protein n=1 Tax=Microbacterium paraoxydans TaxID=199592 RepID=UPI003D73082D